MKATRNKALGASLPEGAADVSADAGKPPVAAGGAQPDTTLAGEIGTSPATNTPESEGGAEAGVLGTGKPASAESFSVRVTTKREGFRRAGMTFYATREFKPGELSEVDVAMLSRDPSLVVEIIPHVTSES